MQTDCPAWFQRFDKTKLTAFHEYRCFLRMQTKNDQIDQFTLWWNLFYYGGNMRSSKKCRKDRMRCRSENTTLACMELRRNPILWCLYIDFGSTTSIVMYTYAWLNVHLLQTKTPRMKEGNTCWSCAWRLQIPCSMCYVSCKLIATSQIQKMKRKPTDPFRKEIDMVSFS
jgi:hypothetical protein